MGTGGSLGFPGENPTRNAVIGFYLGAGARGEVQVEISDVTGEHTREFTFAAEPGIGMLEWNMRFDPTAEQLRQAAARGGRGGRGGGRGGFGGGRGGGQQEPPEFRQGDVGGGGGGRGGDRGGGPQGMMATTGDYRVTLTVNGQSYVGKITVREDPMLAGQ
jgi:hypothetical protein